MPHDTPPMTPDHSRVQVLILAVAQALFQTASVLVLTIGSLAAGQITGRPELLTAPIAASLLGTAAATFPASALMARMGRRSGFILGAMLGVLGGLVAAGGVWVHSLAMLCAGTFLAGAYQGFAQFYRFAASEVADDAFRPRAISWVLAGGIVAAFLGPMLARAGSAWLAPLYAGSFLLLSCISLAAAGVLLFLRVPAAVSGTAEAGRPRSWLEMVCQPVYFVALFGAVTGAGVMMLAMTATPIAMAHHHHSLGEAASVIQFHILGMFVPSFFTGSLIARFGVLKIMTAGVLILAGHIAISLSGVGVQSFTLALICLGVGWNFLYVGGTTLLTRAYTPAEKSRAQATNDMTVFAVGFVGSLASGAMLQALGWQMMNLVLLPWLGLTLVVLMWFGLRKQKD
jgi:MFS family permease